MIPLLPAFSCSQSVSAAEQATLPRLPASLAPHLSLKRIRHLTITSSTVLRTQLPLRAQPATKALRPARMVLDNLFGLCSPVQGLFSVVRPKELVFLLPRDDFAAFASLSLSAVRSPRLRARSRNVVVVVGQLSQKLNSPVNQHYPPSSPDEIHTLFFGPDVAVGGLNGVYPEHKISLRFVLLPSACKDHVKLKAFLAVRHKGGALHPGWFNSRPGSYVVEVPFEEAKLWVETGLAAIPVESRKLVVVQVQPPGSWGEGLAWAGGVRLKRE